MRQFLKVVIGIIILAGICFGVYTVLPEYPHNMVKSFVQPVMDKQAKVRIDEVKNLVNKDLEATYQKILESHTTSSFWIYDANEAAGTETVTFYAKGAHINIKDVPDHEDHLYTSCGVKFVFAISGKTVNITAYIEKEAQDEVIKEVMFKQLLSGN